MYGLLERECEDVLGLVIGDDEREEFFLVDGLFERVFSFNKGVEVDGEEISLSVPLIISIN